MSDTCKEMKFGHFQVFLLNIENKVSNVKTKT